MASDWRLRVSVLL